MRYYYDFNNANFFQGDCHIHFGYNENIIFNMFFYSRGKRFPVEEIQDYYNARCKMSNTRKYAGVSKSEIYTMIRKLNEKTNNSITRKYKVGYMMGKIAPIDKMGM